jgi:hypothetical protein
MWSHSMDALPYICLHHILDVIKKKKVDAQS